MEQSLSDLPGCIVDITEEVLTPKETRKPDEAEDEEECEDCKEHGDGEEECEVFRGLTADAAARFVMSSDNHMCSKISEAFSYSSLPCDLLQFWIPTLGCHGAFSWRAERFSDALFTIWESRDVPQRAK